MLRKDWPMSWALALLLTLPLAGSALAEEREVTIADVTPFAIDGFRLGMTPAEAVAVSPDMKVKAVLRDGGRVMGFEGKARNVIIYFTISELGKEAFYIEKKERHNNPDPVAILSELAKVYGPPTQTGRDLTTTRACWGRCYGNNPRLLYQLRMFGPVNPPFPSSLLLHDPGMEKKNKKAFMAKKGK